MELISYPKLESSSENNFIDQSLVEKNNKRWIDLSDKQQKGFKQSVVGCAGIVAVLSNAVFLGEISATCGAIEAYGVSVLYSTPSLIAGLSLTGSAATISSTVSIISCCIPKKCVFDMHHLQDVLNARQEILEGNARRGSQLLECGILSKEIYDEFMVLANEKRQIENKCRNAINQANKLSSTMEIITKQIDAETMLYDQSIYEWEKKWEQFKPSLIADLPDPSLLINDKIDVQSE